MAVTVAVRVAEERTRDAAAFGLHELSKGSFGHNVDVDVDVAVDLDVEGALERRWTGDGTCN